jgi:hypothetical protein
VGHEPGDPERAKTCRMFDGKSRGRRMGFGQVRASRAPGIYALGPDLPAHSGPGREVFGKTFLWMGHAIGPNGLEGKTNCKTGRPGPSLRPGQGQVGRRAWAIMPSGPRRGRAVQRVRPFRRGAAVTAPQPFRGAGAGYPAGLKRSVHDGAQWVHRDIDLLAEGLPVLQARIPVRQLSDTLRRPAGCAGRAADAEGQRPGELAESLVLAFSIACSLVVRCRWPRLRTWLSMAVIASLQVSYGLCSYSWATILGTEAS